MAYPGIALVAMVGVGLGLALWYLLTDTTNESPHESGPPPRDSGPPPRRNTPLPNNSWETTDSRRRRRKSNSKAKEECAICTEPMDDRSVTVKCGHIYHWPCIKKWREFQDGNTATCPLCRQTI